MTNISDATENFNLSELLTEIRAALRAVDMSLEAVDEAQSSALDHAITAGKHLKQAHDQVGRGFRGWLKKHGLKRSTCYQYMQLSDQSVHDHRHFKSIGEALRALRAKSKKPRVAKTPPGEIDAAAVIAWFNCRALRGDRLAVLRAIDVNVDEFLEAAPGRLRQALENRLIVPPSRTAEKKARLEAAHTEKMAIRSAEDARAAVAQLKEASASQKRAAEADERRESFRIVNGIAG
jgi:hypothetical protein